MFYSVGHTDRPALRNAQHGERFSEVGRVDDVLNVLDPPLEREVADVPVGHSATALVVTNVTEAVAEEAYPMTPDRTLPFVLEMGQPISRLDDHRSSTRFSPGELDSVFGADVSDSLGHPLSHRISLCSRGPGRMSWEISRSISKPGRNAH